MTVRRLLTAVAALALPLTAIGFVDQSAHADPAHDGTLSIAAAPSPTLGEDIAYTVYLPYRYADSSDDYPTLYLLHGRGDSMDAWTQVKGDLDDLIEDGKIDPVIVIMPDAPWSDRASYYVDSAYTGPDAPPGQPVETAFVTDLINHVDTTYRTVDDRAARGVGGYSMGGAGALRFALAHQDLFSAALVLSPAVYTPLPPEDSSAREFGAYGVGDDLFVDGVYESRNYPALLPNVDTDLPVHLFIAVGDDEYVNPEPEDALHDLDTESALLYAAVKRTPGLSAELRIVDGGHDWGVWEPEFVEGVQDLFHYLTTTPAPGLVGPLLGTLGDDRAGGLVVAEDASVTAALGALGSINDQPYAGGLDIAVTQQDPSGATRGPPSSARAAPTARTVSSAARTVRCTPRATRAATWTASTPPVVTTRSSYGSMRTARSRGVRSSATRRRQTACTPRWPRRTAARTSPATPRGPSMGSPTPATRTCSLRP